MPLISLAHVSFYSADPVSELEENDLEKVRADGEQKIVRSLSSNTHVTYSCSMFFFHSVCLLKLVDKIGRSARRSVDIHVRQTMGRPRIATTLQRVSSLFAFAPTPGACLLARNKSHAKKGEELTRNLSLLRVLLTYNMW